MGPSLNLDLEKNMIKHVMKIRLAVVILWLFVPPNSRAADRETALSPLDRIARAEAGGKLTEEEATLLSIRAIAHPDLLPAEYQSAERRLERCGTPVIQQAWQDASRFSPRGQAQLAAELARPSTSSAYDSPNGYFRIHYNTSGAHAVPLADLNTNSVPDYVEKLADYCDSSWRQEVLQYGYLSPPSDGGVGGNSAYDIYCQSIGAYGYASTETPGPQPWNDWTSYVVVHSTFAGFPANTDPDGDVAGAAKATVAHEFQHSCQFAYDAGENGSWMEMCATYIEDEVFDPVNDNYNYLPNFFSQPQTALFSVSPYGAFVWPRYLSEVYGDAAIKAIWDDCISGSALIAMDNVLSGMGSSRDLAVAGFTAWNWITGSRNDGVHYEEGGAYPLMPVMRTHSSYPVGTQTSTQPPGGMACNYVRFNTGSLPAGRSLSLTFDGEDGWLWAARIVARNSGGTFDIVLFSLDGGGVGAASLPNASSYTNVALVSSLLNVTGGANYEYSACVGPAAPDLLLPTDASMAAVPVDLEWDGVAGAISYRYQVDDLPLFGSPEVDSVIASFTTVVPGLAQGSLYYWRVSVTDACGESGFGAVHSFTATCGVSLTGDVDASGSITSADLIVMVNHLFKSGPPPLPQPEAGDVDCSGTLTSADIVKLVNFTFKSGPPPCDVCTIL